MEKNKIVDIVKAVQDGEEKSATALYDAFQKELYFYILKTVNDPQLAEDLLQDTFVEILQTINNLKEPAAFPSWSRQIAYHKCTAYYKKRRDVLADENEDGTTVFDTIPEENSEFIPDEALDKEDLKQTINAMIAELPMEQRSALLMRYFDEMSVKEIAEIQGVTEGAVKSRLNYGRKSIKEAVEKYEKKHGVKLRCAGVIPLLLWLFREFSVSNGISLTSTTASATYTAAKASTPLISETAKAGAKTAGKFTAKKAIAGIAAATVATGGIAAAVLLKPEKPPMTWSGYGTSFITYTRRFDLNIEKMDDKYISGHLEVSCLYQNSHDTNFTGKGTVNGNEIIYEITFETPAKLGVVPTEEFEQTELEYDKKSEVFSFDSFYDVEMERNNRNAKVLYRNESWSGIGNDDFYNVTKNKNHNFKLDVKEMTEDEISGRFSLSYNGKADHSSDFTGRGYLKDGIIHYEILLETPRTEKNIIKPITMDRFWLEYDTKTEIMEIPSPGLYSVKMEKS